ncbi:MAG: BlaI/MecI/CopY family transcriptional regulator [Bacteroidales bacterium]|jgi:BlaI family penicillinase repressor|nr:BlaI/MecI/CopY family transcriptional regulator [Bacteroidales bacterium]MDP2235536.1 BlaI/MecI/CopY family transcriptional regulator [Bacteroidales bacterium]
MNNKIKPTESELEILQLIWKHGPSTVRQINEFMNENRVVGYTTSLKLLQIMTQKGIVRADKTDRSHVYSALLKEDETQQQLVDQLLQAAFGGSAKKLVMQALGNKKTSQAELEEIKLLIERLEGGEA